MDFENWKNEFDLLCSELEMFGKLAEFNIIVELDTSNGIAGAIDKIINITKQNLSTIETLANKQIYKITEMVKSSNNIEETLNKLIYKNKAEIISFKNKEYQFISDGYAAKGISFLTERLGTFVSILFTPIITRLTKTIIDAIPETRKSTDELIRSILFVSILETIMVPISSKNLFGAITPVVLLIYIKSLNLYLK